MDLRVNTFSVVLIGPFVDGTNGKDTEEAETPVVLLSKNGGGLASKNEATVPVHNDAGYYLCLLNGTDLESEGNIVLVIEDSATALGVRHEYNVLSEAAWDSLYIAKDAGFMDVNIKTIGRADATETQADNLEGALGTANVIDAAGDWNTVTPDAAGVLPATGAIASGVWDSFQIDHTTANTMGAMATELAVINSAIGIAGAGLTNLGGSSNDWNTVTPDAAGVAPTAQEIEDEVWDALQSAHTTVDTMGAMATELALIDTATMRGTDSANTVVPDAAGVAPATGAIATGVWDALQATHATADTMGAMATELALIDTAAMRGTDGANTVVPDAAGVAPTAQEIEDEIWDALQSAHTTVDTMGAMATELALIDTTAMRGTDGANTVVPDAAGVAPTAAEIETEIWDALQSAHVTVNTMGAMATELALIPTTAMRGTDSAALAASFTYTVVGQVDANVTYINDTEITGAGVAAAKWGPA